MQIGCGLYEHMVRGKRYLYFWHYETQGGRRRQVTEYLGPAGSARSRQEAASRVDAYFARAAEALSRLRAETMEQLAA
jgi:hypothetical protein